MDIWIRQPILVRPQEPIIRFLAEIVSGTEHEADSLYSLVAHGTEFDSLIRQAVHVAGERGGLPRFGRHFSVRAAREGRITEIERRRSESSPQTWRQVHHIQEAQERTCLTAHLACRRIVSDVCRQTDPATFRSGTIDNVLEETHRPAHDCVLRDGSSLSAYRAGPGKQRILTRKLFCSGDRSVPQTGSGQCAP